MSGLAAVFLATIIAYNAFSDTEYFAVLLRWSADNLILLILILIVLKIVGILWPPLPGVVFMIAAIPVIGWVPAFGVDLVGGMIGTSLAFGLTRRYGPKVIVRVFGQSGLDQVQRFRLQPGKELEVIILMRVLMGAVSELVSYGAGLTNIKFRNLFLGSLISYLLIGLPLFYLIGFVLKSENLLLAVIPLLIGLIVIYLLRGRYFLWED